MKTNACILGPIGAGKSTSLRTLLPEYPDPTDPNFVRRGAGKTVLLLTHEPGWDATNGDLTCDMGFHVREQFSAEASIDVLIEWLEKISDYGMDTVMSMQLPPEIRGNYHQFISSLKWTKNYVCQRCEKEFGHIMKSLDDNYAFCQDGLTGITRMAKQFYGGPRPSISKAQYYNAQDMILEMVVNFVSMKASYILIAHWASKNDNVEGGSTITVSTLGQRLGDQLLPYFSEVILARREGNNFFWNVDDPRVELKARKLNYGRETSPNFVHLLSE